MIKKCRSFTRAVQNNGENFKEIDNFVREITGGKYYVESCSPETNGVVIIDARDNLVLDVCDLDWYIVACKDLKYAVLRPDVFERLFVFID